jgi:phosphate-selective porin OprO/OprP
LVLALASRVDAQVKTSQFTLDAHAKSQMDFRGFPQETGTESKDVFDVHRARVGIDGDLMKRFKYQVEGELHDRDQPWRDVFVNARVVRTLELRAGQFKMPFGLDQQTGSMDLDFNYRSLAGTYAAPGRDIGVMVHGRVLKDLARYQVGVFAHGGDNARSSERTSAQTNRTFAGRVVVKPWRASRAGIALTDGALPAGANSVRGKTVPGDSFFERFYVNGRRQRVGGEFQWRPGPFGVQTEIMRVRDQRLRQGVDNENLPDAIVHGWYVSGTWLATGERKKDSIEPAHPFLRRGIGALEIAGRVEQLRMSSAGAPVSGAIETPRSSWISPRADRVWTAGINWFINGYVKLQANLIREQRTIAGRAVAGHAHVWSRTLRLQFGF